ncbi:MAG: hypothetical protein K9L62_10900 [Vallitaleaceae bacterium]|nr:hypothetical protein [Vallitaleaceae bacterium]
MSKKNYMSLLKEAISEFDTSDNLEVKGPMLDPILAWDGDGEIPVYKDAASILERYYFNENRDEGVNTLDEAELDKGKQNDKGSSSGPSMKHTDGAGTEQGGTSDSDTVLGSKEEKAKDIKKEQAGDEDDDEMEEVEEKEYSGKDVPEKKKYTDESEDLDMENAIIEKLIAEMEDEDEDDDDEKEEVEEGEVMTQKGAGVKNPSPKEKKSTDPEQDAKGAGTEQAGTGTDAGQVPDRKDQADKMTKAKNYNESDENAMIEAALAELESEIAEQDDAEDDDKPEDKEEEKDLDVDKEMASEQSAVPGGPSPKKTGEDWDDEEEAYSEAFQLFKEAIKDDEEDEDDDMEDDKED